MINVNQLAMEAQALTAVCLFSTGHWIGGAVCLVMLALSIYTEVRNA